jgi:carbamoyl-phosphate synthase large subunit
MIIMKNKKIVKILIIGGGGGTVSEGLLKSLRSAGYYNLTIFEYSNNAAHLYRVNDRIISNYSPDDGYVYIQDLISVCQENGFKIVIPGSTWEAKIIAEYEKEFYDKGVVPLVNNIETINIGNDKWETYKRLQYLGIATPKSFIVKEDALRDPLTKFPLIIKPRQGRGSQNVFHVTTAQELDILCNYFEKKRIKYLIQEYMSRNDSEYTVGVISNKNGRVIQSIVMRRLLMGGATGYAEVCKPSEINSFCEDVALKVKSTGPINIQLRLDSDNKPSIFEINPRFSGSNPMRTLAGFNEVSMMIEDKYFDETIKIAKIGYGNRYFRAFQEIEILANQDIGIINNLL